LQTTFPWNGGSPDFGGSLPDLETSPNWAAMCVLPDADLRLEPISKPMDEGVALNNSTHQLGYGQVV
jgi:hypothetical protein